MGLIDDLKAKYQGKKVLVVGLGLQGGGVGVAKFFAELGAKVTVTDKKNETQLADSIEKLKKYSINYSLGGHRTEDFLNSDIIFKGPGVPWSLKEIVEAEKKGIPIEMEMAFVARCFPGKIIGITGTRGKSTTTNLIYKLLKDNGFETLLGGGLPGISNLEYLKKANNNTWLVAELSSWSLSGFHKKKISPHIAVFTNFYPDHLNYYQNMDDYLFDKKAIFMYQKASDYLVINKKLLNFLDKNSIKSKVLTFSSNDVQENFENLTGDHNKENIAAVLKVVEILNIEKTKAINTISNFQSLPFRQQIIAKKQNVIFVNDTTSTTPTATIYAIKRFSDKPMILILGGNSKNLPFEKLIEELNNPQIKKIFLLAGSFTDEILPFLEEKYQEKISKKIYDNLQLAIKEAFLEAKKINNDVYLVFSPGATSFAMFNNEFHRGEEFNKIVNKL
ncbi:MAG: UDP-N-acetylmuramoylalanine--D-glutamate ligase [Patescibacteria group bacterium]|nr:MAG: UDP-N-acetylmuramoylalanine--D-glutamate ligase [Patescibacteria group bacterium]